MSLFYKLNNVTCHFQERRFSEQLHSTVIINSSGLSKVDGTEKWKQCSSIELCLARQPIQAFNDIIQMSKEMFLCGLSVAQLTRNW